MIRKGINQITASNPSTKTRMPDVAHWRPVRAVDVAPRRGKGAAILMASLLQPIASRAIIRMYGMVTSNEMMAITQAIAEPNPAWWYWKVLKYIHVASTWVARPGPP